MAILNVVPDESALAVTAAERLTTLIADAVMRHGNATVCLTGGSTPKRLYELLGDSLQPWRARIEWERVHLFWGDERHVPPDHPDSNFGMAWRALVSQVPVPSSQVHRMRGEFEDAQDAGREYDAEIRTGFAAAGRDDLTFDVMLLGLGENVHIASLFPGSPVLQQEPANTLSVGVWVPELDTWRITMTPAALLDARAIVMLVSGSRKAEAVRAALERDEEDVVRWPAQLLRRANDRVEWIIDRAAGALLRDVPRA